MESEIGIGILEQEGPVEIQVSIIVYPNTNLSHHAKDSRKDVNLVV
jgi:hypothetical protein